MKNIIVIFILALFSSSIQSQTFTEAEITGTWQVSNVLETGTQNDKAESMLAAYFDFFPDHSFQLRKKKSSGSKGIENSFKNATWNYDEATQTITVNNGNMRFKVLRNDERTIFEFPETGMKLEVVMPM